jgi:hypothetical protein
VFAVCRYQDEAIRLADAIRSQFTEVEDVTITTASDGAHYGAIT